jgi:Ca2+-transporting ATPase
VAVVHVGFLNTAFSTVPLAPAQWLGCVALSSAVLWLEELRKWVGRAVGR